MTKKKFLFVIPARAGSKGIPRKCMRPMAGKPLIGHVIETVASAYAAEDIVISTDDQLLVAWVGKQYPTIRCCPRPPSLAGDDATLDEVVHDLCASDEGLQERYEFIVTIQPTSPLLSTQTIRRACEKLMLQDVASVLTVQEKRKLTWRQEPEGFVPNYSKRLNRQELPATYEETGAVIGCKISRLLESGTRVNQPIDLVVTEDVEGIDIDSNIDWALAEQVLSNDRMAFVVIGSAENGSGHVYRAMTIAHEFPTRKIKFFTCETQDLAISVVSDNNYSITTFQKHAELFEQLREFGPATIVNDALDSDWDYMKQLKSIAARVVTFEDLGSGSRYADAIINELYPPSVLGSNSYNGPSYACLRQEFLDQVEDEERLSRDGILLTFGGTDPSDLTQKTLSAIGTSQLLRNQRIVVVLGRGYHDPKGVRRLVRELGLPKVEVYESVQQMAKLMRSCVTAVSSAGRTVYELAACGVAVCTICQNMREYTHLYANSANGIRNFGLYSEVEWSKVTAELEKILTNKSHRDHLLELSTTFNPHMGLKNVIEAIRGT